MAWQAHAAKAAYQLVTAVQQSEMLREQAKLNREIADLNARYAEEDAFNMETHGYEQVARYQGTVDEVLGAQKVTMAAQNIDSSYGTASQVQQETKLTGFLNQLDILNQASAAALGYRNQARQIRLQGAMNQGQANLYAQSTLNANILSAAQTGATGYSDYKKSTRS